jgi:hypothetical protein
MTHQLDRIEEMLQRLTDNRVPPDMLHRAEVQKQVLALFGFALST